MTFPSFRRSALGAAALSVCALMGVQFAWAQTSNATASGQLQELTVTGTASGTAEMDKAPIRLSGDALLLKSQGTLGETLTRESGISSSYFGPNASRPIVRGQDGDRVRILQNGGGAPDASNVSADHAVPTDALASERIEVLRGPAALRYGGAGLGGVINVIDDRIPSEPIGGFGGRADLGYGTGNRETSGGVLLEGGDDRYALHVDAFGRDADDVAVPIQLACEKPGSPALQQRMCNSASRSHGGAVGGSLFFDQGWIGASASTYRSNYGTVAEDDVSIDMRSNRYALEGEWRVPGDGFFSTLHGQLSHTDYQHTEFEGVTPGTTFSNKGNDFRLEAKHRGFGGLRALQGVIGVQGADTRFDAEGEEAFAPRSRTRTRALFVTEELPLSWGQLNFGARTERVEVDSFGASDPSVTRFVEDERRFNPSSAAFGALVPLSPQWQLTGNLAYTERAPKDYELFANGPHVATGAWEMGDPALGKEKSLGLDVGAQWQSGPHSAKLSAYVSKFRNYIGLVATGAARDEEGERVSDDPEALPEYLYQGMRARFTGLEASGTVRLAGEGGWLSSSGAPTWELEWRGDLVRATATDTGQPLPRIAPARAGATLVWELGAWNARLGFDAYAAQHRVPPEGQRETAGYTLWNAALTYKSKLARANLTWYARIDNLTDRLAYSATSILTTTAFPNAPLPGRSLKLGVRATF